MNINKKAAAAALIGAMLLGFSGCSGESSEVQSDFTTASEELSEGVSAKAENNVASGDETVPYELDVSENMTPIYGDSLKDGVYDITVDSSSSMFSVTKCELTVEGGGMTACMTMSGTGYLYVFMGKGEDAEESGFISYVENENGEHTYTVPVEALDMGIECAAFSRKKEQWYDRTLIFRSDSLPSDAFADGFINTVQSLGIADGAYTVEVTLEGGSGRSYVESPAVVTVKDGNAEADIIWSSSNYDYMVVNGEKYYPINSEGNSEFIIPITGFDYRMPVSADTTAMSQPYEIEYTLYFDSETIVSQ
ncbi:MAG: hypothetical protein LUI05_05250 [Oscillospiraceae bacterium]|nr:hypothetical protein [Oscillospiraceae bacterium]